MEKCPLEGGAGLEDVRYREVSCVCLFCRKRGNRLTLLLSTFEAVSLAKEWASYGMRLNELKALPQPCGRVNPFGLKVCTISFERPVNYLCDAWHVFPPKYEAWIHFNRPWTEYQCQGVVWTLLIIFTESVNGSTCLSVYLIVPRLRNVNLLCFSDSIEGIDFLNCTLKCSVTLKLANQNRYFY